MRVIVQSTLPCDGDLAWAEVQKSALLQHIARPLVSIVPISGETFPERWPAAISIRCRSYLFGIVPLGTRTLTFERIDHESHEIQTRESDLLVRRWDHLIRVEPRGAGSCQYSDTIEIDAGLLTPAVWLFARLFYGHRQRRWQNVAKRLQAARGKPSSQT